MLGRIRVGFALCIIILAAALAPGVARVDAQTPGAPVTVGITIQQIGVGQTGTATARFNRTLFCAPATICIDPTTGLPIAINFGSVLNGTVIFTIQDSTIATWVNAQPTATAGTPSSTAGFQTNASQTAVRCGPFPTTTFPSAVASTGLASFFGGCESVQAQYIGLRPGVTNISVTFVPDLPGAFGAPVVPGFPNVGALLGQFAGFPNPSDVKALEVVGAAPVGNVQLARGCNNISPTVTESASAYAARVNPSSALVAIWEHQAASNTFRGFSPIAGAPNDLTTVTRLRPVFVCVSGSTTLSQPAA